MFKIATCCLSEANNKDREKEREIEREGLLRSMICPAFRDLDSDLDFNLEIEFRFRPNTVRLMDPRRRVYSPHQQIVVVYYY